MTEDPTRCTPAENDAVTLAALLDELERTGVVLSVVPRGPEVRTAGRYLILRALYHKPPTMPMHAPVLTVVDTAEEAVQWLRTYTPEATP